MSWPTCLMTLLEQHRVQPEWIRWPPEVHKNLNRSVICWWNIRSRLFACALALQCQSSLWWCACIYPENVGCFQISAACCFWPQNLSFRWLASISEFDLLGFYRFIRNYLTCNNFRKGVTCHVRLHLRSEHILASWTEFSSSVNSSNISWFRILRESKLLCYV